MLLFVVSLAALSLWLGSWPLGPKRVFLTLVGGGSAAERMAILGFRLPRIVFALLAGAGLSVSGVILQAVLRNDLAAPGVLGVSAGGSLAVVTVLLVGGLALASPWVVPGASILGGALALLIVVVAARIDAVISPERLLLTGIAVSAGLSAMSIVLSMHIDPQVSAYAVAWMSGSLSQGNWNYVVALGGWLILFLPTVWMMASSLNVIRLGDDAATGLGVPVGRHRLAMLGFAVAISGVCMALAGGIVFLGVLAPHIARKIVGPDYRIVLPAAAVVGAGLLLAADTLGRTAFQPLEFPAGVTINALGSPYFLFLLMRSPS